MCTAVFPHLTMHLCVYVPVHGCMYVRKWCLCTVHICIHMNVCSYVYYAFTIIYIAAKLSRS